MKYNIWETGKRPSEYDLNPNKNYTVKLLANVNKAYISNSLDA